MQVQKTKPGYKIVKSNFGQYEEIPEEWKILSIEDMTEIPVSDGPHETPKFLSEGIPFLSVDNIVNNKLQFDNLRYISKENHEKYSKKCKPKKNDFLLGKAASVGKIALVDTDIEFNIWSPLAVIRLKRQFFPPFYYQFFQSNNFQKQISILVTTSTQKNISMKDIKKLQCIIPQFIEQQKISSILSNVDLLIEKTQKIIQKTILTKKGMMQQLLIKGIGHTKFKKVKWLFGKEIEIPKEWEQHKLKNLVYKIGDGIHSTPNYVDESNFYFINGNNLVNGSIIFFDNTKNVNENEYQKYKLDLNEDTVLLSINGTIGNVSFYDNEKIILGKSVCYINCNEKLNKKFLFYLLQSHNLNKYFRRELTGTTIFNLSLASIRNSPINLPKIEEQEKIVSILSNMDSLIHKQLGNKSNIEFLKKGLMQKLLTGSLRV